MELPVHFGSRQVATISANALATTLTYTDAWLSAPDRFPVSLSMPLQAELFGSERVLPWLMNLLPEGEPLRAMTRAVGVAPEDALGLIAETGNDLAGALSIAPQQPRGEPGNCPIPDAAALERIIEELPARPFLIGEEGVSMSLAGAQDKLPVALIDGQLAVPINGAPSTHILKPDNPRLPGSVQNEALCMTTRLLRELPTAVQEVAAMPAGPSMLEIFAKEIEERATEVRTHSAQEGVPEIASKEDEAPAIGASAYSSDGDPGTNG